MNTDPQHPPRDSNYLTAQGGRIISTYLPTIYTVAEMGVFLGSKAINLVKSNPDSYKDTGNDLSITFSFNATSNGTDTPISFTSVLPVWVLSMIGTWQRTITDIVTASLGQVLSGQFVYDSLEVQVAT